MKLTWYGHSAFRIEIGQAVIMIDPFLTGNPSFKGDVDQVTKGVTHLLLTHGHNDHVGDSLAILKQVTPSSSRTMRFACTWSGRALMATRSTQEIQVAQSIAEASR